MYRAYVLITDIDELVFDDFIALISSIYGTNLWDEEKDIELESTRNYDIYAAYLFELGMNDAQWITTFRWFSERQASNTDPIALVGVGAEDNLMRQTVNVGDVALGMPYYWWQFVNNVTRRFDLE